MADPKVQPHTYSQVLLYKSCQKLIGKKEPLQHTMLGKVNIHM